MKPLNHLMDATQSSAMGTMSMETTVADLHWDGGLVAVSILIAITGSLIALNLAGEMRKTTGIPKTLWATTGALVMGLSIWSMHFIGMQALVIPGMHVSYDPWLMGLSIAAAAVGAGLAFSILERPALKAFHLFVGSLAMGIAISGMHYMGMASMRMNMQMHYDPILFGLSILVGILASAGALGLAFRVHEHTSFRSIWVEKVGSAFLMGLAITSMHYIGMLAVTFLPIDGLHAGRTLHNVGAFNLSDLLVGAGILLGFLMLLLSAQAIAERQQAVNELTQSEERFRTMADASMIFIVIEDPHGRPTYLNQSFRQYTGLLDSETQTNWFGCVHPHDMPVLKAVRAATSQRQDLELRLLRDDGAYRWMFVSIAPMRAEDGALALGKITSLVDIDDRKKLEARYQRTVESGLLGIIFWDDQGRIFYANEYIRTLLGYSEAVISASSNTLSWLDLLDPGVFSTDASSKPLSHSQLEIPGGCHPLEARLRHQNGQWIDVLIGASPIQQQSVTKTLENAVLFRPDSTSPKGQQEWVAYILDITDKKQVESTLKDSQDALQRYASQLERSNQELDQFATVASHDLQAPLRKVLFFIDCLNKALVENHPDEVQDYLKRIEKSSTRMQSLIHDLLKLSRVTRQGDAFHKIALGEVIDDALAELELPIQETGAHIKIGVMPSIEADAGQLQQLFINLLQNALKFHKPEEAPSIHIFTTSNPPNCRIVFEDAGIGFAPDQSERIFNVFERLHGEAQYPGTGMGLAIVRKIVERHQGVIKAEGTPNGGSRFIIDLPYFHTKESAPLA